MAFFSSLRSAKQHFKSLPQSERHKATKYCAFEMVGIFPQYSVLICDYLKVLALTKKQTLICS